MLCGAPIGNPEDASPRLGEVLATADVIAGPWRRASGRSRLDVLLETDVDTYLPGDLLVKMDIASMHCGLETRSPLLDHEVIEFCARLPVQLKVKHQTGKYLLKKLAERYFPASFVHRPKMGFGIPLATWLRGPLRDVLRDTLLDARLMEPLSGAVIARTLRQFESGDDGHKARLWTLLMFGCWRMQQGEA